MRTLCSAYPVLTTECQRAVITHRTAFSLASTIKPHWKRTSSATPHLDLSLSPGQYNGLWKAHCSLPARQPTVDILIPTRDRIDLLQRCIESILSLTDYDNYTITVVDNDSKEAQTQAFHEKMSSLAHYHRINFAGDFNYSAINNFAANRSTAEYLILLNNDTEVLQKNWLLRMIAELGQEDVACVGTRLIYPNGLLQHGGVTLGLHGVAGHRNQFARSRGAWLCSFHKSVRRCLRSYRGVPGYTPLALSIYRRVK